MSTPRVAAEDLRAAAEAHQELGPEYRDAVIDSFLEKIEARLDERVNARLAAVSPARKRSLPKSSTDARSTAALAGITIGAVGVGASLTLLARLFASWVGPPPHFWLYAVILIASAACCGAGLARAFRRRR